MDSNYLKQSLSVQEGCCTSKYYVGLSFCSSSFVERKKIPIVSTADMGSEGQTSAPFCVLCVFFLLRGKRKQRKVQGSNPWTWKRTVPSRLKSRSMLNNILASNNKYYYFSTKQNITNKKPSISINILLNY